MDGYTRRHKASTGLVTDALAASGPPSPNRILRHTWLKGYDDIGTMWRQEDRGLQASLMEEEEETKQTKLKVRTLLT